jgi:hypothetical protein
MVDVDPFPTIPTGACTLPASVGNHYLGLWLLPSTSMNATSTSVSAPVGPLTAGGQYAFSISAGIATSMTLLFPASFSVGRGASVVLTIHGGTSLCDQSDPQLWLQQLDMSNHDTWTQFSKVVIPTQNDSYLTIEAHFLATKAPLQSSYVILDNLTSPGPCK